MARNGGQDFIDNMLDDVRSAAIVNTIITPVAWPTDLQLDADATAPSCAGKCLSPSRPSANSFRHVSTTSGS